MAGARAALHDRAGLRPARSRRRLLFDRVDACARVQASIELIAAAGCSPDLLVLSGDVADRGEAEAYVRLRPVIDAALDRFGARLLVAPGNHDDVARLREHLLGRPPDCSPLDEVVRVGGLRLIGVDSSVPGEVQGELDDAQLEALADELAEPARGHSGVTVPAGRGQPLGNSGLGCLGS